MWSLIRRAAPSLNLSADYHRGVPGAKPYPLSVKPDKKLTVADVFALMRDHYEGTDFDMTQGVDAGPYGTPNRWRPIDWKVGRQVEYTWERPISTQQTGFSFVSQSRAWLPDPVGGVYWYGLDDTYFTCYVPLYCGIDALPESYTVGQLNKFSWDRRVVGVQFRGELREPALLRHAARHPGGADASWKASSWRSSRRSRTPPSQLAKSDPELRRVT